MKKKIVVIIFIVVFLISCFLFLYSQDFIRFKISYEYINSVEYSNGKKIEVSIPWDNRIHYLSEKELLSFLKNGTGILYFGYNTCPWCRNIIPILIDTAKENSIHTIYYADIHSLDFSKIREELYQYLDSYLEENAEGKKVLAVPDVYVIKEGQVMGHHEGTVGSYHNPYSGMNVAQKQELVSIYDKLIGEIKNE